MKTLEAISSFFGKYMAFIVLAVAALSLFVPQFTIMPLLAFALAWRRLCWPAFPTLAMATVPGAIFSVWHNISGAILANIYSRMNNE